MLNSRHMHRTNPIDDIWISDRGKGKYFSSHYSHIRNSKNMWWYCRVWKKGFLPYFRHRQSGELVTSVFVSLCLLFLPFSFQQLHRVIESSSVGQWLSRWGYQAICIRNHPVIFFLNFTGSSRMLHRKVVVGLNKIIFSICRKSWKSLKRKLLMLPGRCFSIFYDITIIQSALSVSMS